MSELAGLLSEYDDWERERSRLEHLDGTWDTPAPKEWHLSDDSAVTLLRALVAELRQPPGVTPATWKGTA